MERINTIWDTIGRVCVYLLFGLGPLFFLPLTAFPLAQGKVFFVGTVVFIGVATYLARIIATGTISFPKSWFFATPAGVVFILVFSTIFSISRYTSFLGDLMQPDSFLAMLVYIFALFLVPLFLHSVNDLVKALLSFSVSVGLLSIFALLQFFGVFLLPFDFAKSTGFNTVGTPQALAVCLASAFLVVITVLISGKTSRFFKAFLTLFAVLLGTVLIFINSIYVWIGLLVALALIMSWQLMRGRMRFMKKKEGGEIPPPVSVLGIPLVLMIAFLVLL